MFPILIHIGPLGIRSYPVLVFTGFVVSLAYTVRLTGRLNPTVENQITADHVISATRYGLILGLIGARVLFVAMNWTLYVSAPLDVFKPWKGGLSFFGAPLFAIPYLYWYCQKNRLSFLQFADIVAPGFALGQVFG